MADEWTLRELVGEVERRIAALPPPQNGQVRAVPDDRTVRYYATIGLLERPLAMRGRTAIYGRRHVAQVVAIKRLQLAGRSLAEIQALWPTLDDETLARMSGVPLGSQPRTGRTEFWKRAPASVDHDDGPARSVAAPPTAPSELRIELAPDVVLLWSLTDEHIAISPDDVRAIRAAAAPLVAELIRRRVDPEITKTTKSMKTEKENP